MHMVTLFICLKLEEYRWPFEREEVDGVMLQELVASSALTELRVTSKLWIEIKRWLEKASERVIRFDRRPICETGRAIAHWQRRPALSTRDP